MKNKIQLFRSQMNTRKLRCLDSQVEWGLTLIAQLYSSTSVDSDESLKVK